MREEEKRVRRGRQKRGERVRTRHWPRRAAGHFLLWFLRYARLLMIRVLSFTSVLAFATGGTGTGTARFGIRTRGRQRVIHCCGSGWLAADLCRLKGTTGLGIRAGGEQYEEEKYLGAHCFTRKRTGRDSQPITLSQTPRSGRLSLPG